MLDNAGEKASSRCFTANMDRVQIPFPSGLVVTVPAWPELRTKVKLTETVNIIIRGDFICKLLNHFATIGFHCIGNKYDHFRYFVTVVFVVQKHASVQCRGKGHTYSPVARCQTVLTCKRKKWVRSFSAIMVALLWRYGLRLAEQRWIDGYREKAKRHKTSFAKNFVAKFLFWPKSKRNISGGHAWSSKQVYTKILVPVRVRTV